jgi:hypothetical protein
VLSLAVKGENVYIELKTGPGKLTNTGAITPDGKPEVEVNVGFKLYEARRMATSVLAYLHAWDVLQMMANQQMVSRPAPYLLVPATSPVSGIQGVPENDGPKPDGAVRRPAVAANGRPVTRKDPVTKTEGMTIKRPNGRPIRSAPSPSAQTVKVDTASTEPLDRAKPSEAADTDSQLLKYGDGKMVSKAVLLDYYRQRVQAPAGPAG